MSFIAGLVIGGLLFFAVVCEMIGAFRPIFSCLFLLGTFVLIGFLYFIGLILSPFFLLGIVLAIIIFMATGTGKDRK